ncbi:ACP phosphodiesterase [Niabella sp. W65]|nr:ACP phosphodiesterase [Niabella sp. W65]MCH7369181.1 ACP phosphodiesterase [Niabella sp. W65]
MPSNFEQMFYYMQSQNWLYGYHTRQGIYRSFGGLVKEPHICRIVVRLRKFLTNIIRFCSVALKHSGRS